MPTSDHRVPEGDQRLDIENSCELHEERRASHELVAVQVRSLKVDDPVQDNSGTSNPQIPIIDRHVQLSVRAAVGERQPVEHRCRRVAGSDLRVFQLEGPEHEACAVPFVVCPFGRNACDQAMRVGSNSVHHPIRRFGSSKVPFADPVVRRVSGQEEPRCQALVVVSIHPRIVTAVFAERKGGTKGLWMTIGSQVACEHEWDKSAWLHHSDCTGTTG
ncbi:hypothetical protein [Brevibacterium spongiae]|uniref:Uncharacterized protein n=1 Tax=Brevibacterium spongiae TaxID=2909672 RepID=A0ABY5SMT3_9MICO|nr:hypothetical protein [Brevibacterium spongiae]UVI35880.1 hypothetical protein L1F31_17470 [Brevibacterium spongiae]